MINKIKNGGITINRIFKKKFITSILCLILIYLFAIKNITVSYKPIISAINSRISFINNELDFTNKQKGFVQKLDNFDNIINSIEDAINENVYSRYRMIETYGYIQKLMCKNEISNFEVIKDKEGLMHYSYFTEEPNPIDIIGDNTERFKDNIKDKNIKFIYMMTPDKYVPGKTRFYKGLPYNYANETADNFLEYINRKNIDYIDLRKHIMDSPKNNSELFYKTDHHWRVETAFDEFVNLAYKLNDEYGKEIKYLDYYTDKNNYNFVTYKNSFLGSMGRKTGYYYDGVDDFTVVFPKFKTNYTFYYRTGDHEVNLKGRFEDILINSHVLNNDRNIYSTESDKYSSYLMGNQGVVHITNEDNKNGIKVMFIKDSYTVPLAAFLSTAVSDVYMIDPRSYDGDITEYINNTELDVVIVSFYPQNLTEEFFKF